MSEIAFKTAVTLAIIGLMISQVYQSKMNLQAMEAVAVLTKTADTQNRTIENLINIAETQTGTLKILVKSR